MSSAPRPVSLDDLFGPQPTSGAVPLDDLFGAPAAPEPSFLDSFKGGARSALVGPRAFASTLARGVGLLRRPIDEAATFYSRAVIGANPVAGQTESAGQIAADALVPTDPGADVPLPPDPAGIGAVLQSLEAARRMHAPAAEHAAAVARSGVRLAGDLATDPTAVVLGEMKAAGVGGQAMERVIGAAFAGDMGAAAAESAQRLGDEVGRNGWTPRATEIATDIAQQAGMGFMAGRGALAPEPAPQPSLQDRTRLSERVARQQEAMDLQSAIARSRGERGAPVARPGGEVLAERPALSPEVLPAIAEAKPISLDELFPEAPAPDLSVEQRAPEAGTVAVRPAEPAPAGEVFQGDAQAAQAAAGVVPQAELGAGAPLARAIEDATSAPPGKPRLVGTPAPEVPEVFLSRDAQAAADGRPLPGRFKAPERPFTIPPDRPLEHYVGDAAAAQDRAGVVPPEQLGQGEGFARAIEQATDQPPAAPRLVPQPVRLSPDARTVVRGQELPNRSPREVVAAAEAARKGEQTKPYAYHADPLVDNEVRASLPVIADALEKGKGTPHGYIETGNHSGDLQPYGPTDTGVKAALGLDSMPQSRKVIAAAIRRDKGNPIEMEVAKLIGVQVEEQLDRGQSPDGVGLTAPAGEGPKKGPMEWNGLNLGIEVQKGGTRVASDGSWKQENMPAAYGHIKRTKGADGEAVDVYFGDVQESPMVYVIDQADAKTGAFDEHKVMAGFPNEAAARDAYVHAFSDGKGEQRIGDVTPMTVAEFKTWLDEGKARKGAAADTAPKVTGKPAAFDETPQGAQGRLAGTTQPQSAPTIRTEGREAAGPLFTQGADAAARTEAKAQTSIFDGDAALGRLSKPDGKVNDLGSAIATGGRVVKDVLTYGASLIERGARSFPEWSRAMTEALGSTFRDLGQHLRRLYGEAKREYLARAEAARKAPVGSDAYMRHPERGAVKVGGGKGTATPDLAASQPLDLSAPTAGKPAPPSITTESVVSQGKAKNAGGRGWVRIAFDAARPSLHVLGDLTGAQGKPVGKELRARSETFFFDWERPVAREVGAYEEAINGLSDAQFKETVGALEGRPAKDAKARAAATTIRGLLNGIATDAADAGTFVGFRENYFPHKSEGQAWDFDTIAESMATEKNISIEQATRELNRMIRNGEARDANLERSRLNLVSKDYRVDRDVLREYIVNARRRVSMVKNFGKVVTQKDGTKLVFPLAEANSLIDQIAPGREGGFAQEYARKAIDRFTGREKIGLASTISGKVRKAEAVSKLGLGAISQTLSFNETMAVAGVRNAARGLFDTVSGIAGEKAKAGTLKGPDAEGGRAYSPEELHALKSGALITHIVNELNETAGSGSKREFLYGTGTVDRTMRVVADSAGRYLLRDLEKRGDWKALESMGVTRELLAKNHAEAELRAGEHVANATQFRTGAQHLPLWTTSPLGRVVSQFTSFVYAHSTQFIAPMVRRVTEGDPRAIAQLARWAVLGATVMGEGVNDSKAILKGYGINLTGNKPEDEAHLADVIRSRRITAKQPVLRLLQNLATAGGFGIAQTILERAIGDNPAASLMGAAPRDVIQAGVDTAKGGVRGAAGAAVSMLPIVGPQIRSEFMGPQTHVPGDPAGVNRGPRRVPPVPGLVGRIHDAVSPSSRVQRAEALARMRKSIAKKRESAAQVR